ncbi:hypothetical protein CWI75_09780 [Kineobactrum sediminis]|uniref:Uncharacterized protein n=1 Tax=Kineobactrum sediminis TaxID=1905677 RepID=A0A2N5Y114_9GAMM|nr:hypothetical protein CWI75_09780 [Kineobactrum sediminis]
MEEIYLFHDRTYLSKYFKSFDKVNLIEDGRANYQGRKIVRNYLKRTLRFVLGYSYQYQFLGESSEISSVYLMKPEYAPCCIKGKVKPLTEFVNRLSNDTVRTIISFFRVEAMESNAILVLTQGLDIAGLCSKKDKLNIYYVLVQKLLDYYSPKIVVKIHPSEDIKEYTKLFAGFSRVTIISGHVPFEAISLKIDGKHDLKVYSLRTSSFSLGPNSSVNVLNLIDSVDMWTRFSSDEILETAINELVRLYDQNL